MGLCEFLCCCCPCDEENIDSWNRGTNSVTSRENRATTAPPVQTSPIQRSSTALGSRSYATNYTSSETRTATNAAQSNDEIDRFEYDLSHASMETQHSGYQPNWTSIENRVNVIEVQPEINTTTPTYKTDIRNVSYTTNITNSESRAATSYTQYNNEIYKNESNYSDDMIQLQYTDKSFPFTAFIDDLYSNIVNQPNLLSIEDENAVAQPKINGASPNYQQPKQTTTNQPIFKPIQKHVSITQPKLTLTNPTYKQPASQPVVRVSQTTTNINKPSQDPFKKHVTVTQPKLTSTTSSYNQLKKTPVSQLIARVGQTNTDTNQPIQKPSQNHVTVTQANVTSTKSIHNQLKETAISQPVARVSQTNTNTNQPILKPILDHVTVTQPKVTPTTPTYKQPKAKPVSQPITSVNQTSTTKYTQDIHDIHNSLNQRVDQVDDSRTAINSGALPAWKVSDLLCDEHVIDVRTAEKLVTLFDEGNTIPYIARHRKDVIGEMTTEELRNVRNIYDQIQELKKRIGEIHTEVSKIGLMTTITHEAIINAKSQTALDEIYAPFKQISDRQRQTAFANFAKLNTAADLILTGQLRTRPSNDMLKVAAMKIAASPACMNFLQRRCKTSNCILNTTKEEFADDENEKFIKYYNNTFETQLLQPHQIMAINRGEQKGILRVTLQVESFETPFIRSVEKQFPAADESAAFILALYQCYEEYAVNLFKRMKRAMLTAAAEQAALEVFSSNLKQLLLTAPVRNQRILGMDPGTTLGCKLGLISETGQMLEVGVVFPPPYSKGKQPEMQKQKLRNMLVKHDCSLIAIGNKTGCRDVESWLADLIADDYFAPLCVTYTIVNESGASVYSCSKEAIEEFGKMNPHDIGAVSLARRVQDPLSEIVKVNPRHLGIGMYQHDIDTARLERALAAVASECVSLLGVDLNTASPYLLRHVAGLTKTIAARIVARRKRIGIFAARDDLHRVDGVGTLTYRQCAGFLRVHNGANPLDATAVHPEAYNDARELLKLMQLRVDQIGTNTLRVRLKDCRAFLEDKHDSLGMSRERLFSILDGLTDAGTVDGTFRRKALWFRADVKKMADIEVGMILTGIVVNVTLFGSFVDVGVGRDGLIFIGNHKNVRLQIHDRVKVKVNMVDAQKDKLDLHFVEFINVDES